MLFIKQLTYNSVSQGLSSRTCTGCLLIYLQSYVSMRNSCSLHVNLWQIIRSCAFHTKYHIPCSWFISSRHQVDRWSKLVQGFHMITLHYKKHYLTNFHIFEMYQLHHCFTFILKCMTLVFSCFKNSRFRHVVATAFVSECKKLWLIVLGYIIEQRFSNFFKWGPLSLVRMFYGPPYSWDYQTH